MTAYREEGIEKGREEGISLKERDFTLNLWHLREISFEKIAFLVGVSEQQVADTIVAHLTEQGNTMTEALSVLIAYRQNFPPHR